MRRHINRAVLAILLMLLIHVCIATETPDAKGSTKYLDAVREFADNVLKYGRDTYGPKRTPLFVDGLNVHDPNKPVEWISPEGEKWVLSNLASQQNLFRTLDGLTKITGDPKYRQAAVEAIEYAFDNLRSPNGLLYWGTNTAYDVRGDEVFGWRLGKGYAHCLKGHLPYYNLMWEVDPNGTKQFMEAFWSAHIWDWSNLDMNRWSNYGEIEEPVGKVWKHEYKGGPIFLESDKGGSFLNTGTDLIYAAAWLTKLSGEKEPLVWAKRLANRYVDTRHPNTGISYLMYTKPRFVTKETYDDVLRKLVPGTTKFLSSCFPYLSNPISYKSAVGFFTSTPGTSTHSRIFYWQSLLLVGEMLDGEGNKFKQWALEELIALGKASYHKKDNVYVPILTDGTNLEGYVVKEDGPLGPKGPTLQPFRVGPSTLWAYAMAYRVTNDEFMWEMTRSIALGNEFEDIGATAKDEPKLNLGTDCSDPYALLAFLELHRATGKDDFLKIAKKIGDNILGARFHKGFFVASNNHIYAKLDAINSLVLLHLHLTIEEEAPTISKVWPGVSFFAMSYRKKDIVFDNQIIYTLTESTEPPISLQEAAAVGDTDLVKSIIEKGTGVNAREGAFCRTALHHAAMRGHKDLTEFLMAEGATVNTGDNRGRTPLHFAAQEGNKEIVELLIAKGANVNVKSNEGQTPVDVTAERGRKEVVKLLMEKGGAIPTISTIYLAAFFGDLDRVKSFIGEDTDVNAKDQSGSTPLIMAISGGHIDVVKFLIDKGADVNVGNKQNWTPLHRAAEDGQKIMVELLIAKGADVNAKDQWGETVLEAACWSGHADIAELLLAKGADVNAKDKSGNTPLSYAVWNVDTGLVRLLVEHGAKFDVKARDGWTAFHWAAAQGNRELVEFFVSKGADVSSFHMAACVGDLARVKGFIQQGTDIDTKDEMDGTPLYWAACIGQTDVAEYLVAKGANVNVKTNRNRTPLHQAAKAGARELVELLIAKGADMNAKDNKGKTPLWDAQKEGHTEIVELLKKQVAKE